MSKEKKDPKKKDQYPAYPEHDPKEDIYEQEEEVHIDANEGAPENDLNPENDSPMLKEEKLDDDLVHKDETDDDWNEENFDEEHTGDDLDVPGSELDDEAEEIGSEDEENNYYSLGGPDKD